MGTEPQIICCLCSGLIEIGPTGWVHGNNAEPVATGRCCDFCNMTKVIPARLRNIRESSKVEYKRKHKLNRCFMHGQLKAGCTGCKKMKAKK